MKVRGLPINFWVVTSPTPQSMLGDIFFECDFSRFIRVVRGGLDEQSIVGIFADHAGAVELAERLIQTVQQATEKPDIRIHNTPWTSWYATQESLAGVVLCDRDSAEKVVVEPPKEWGHHWCWNISPDGSGIVMRRTP